MRLLAATLLLAISPATLAAGVPNLGGVLIFSAPPDVIYTRNADFCGTSTVGRCQEIDASGESGSTQVIHVLAAFPPCTTPRVAGVVFGISFDPDLLLIEDHGHCADFELATPLWPRAFEGTVLTWNTPITEVLFEIYWFAAYAYEGATTLEFSPHPTQGGPAFADDAIPANVIGVFGLGTFGFGGAIGEYPCANDGGACCLPDGSCIVSEEPFCDGDYLGRCIPCDPDPCSAGACCLTASECVLLNETFCADRGGMWNGSPSCDPNPCEVVPIVETSWGRIKSGFEMKLPK